MRGYRLGRDDRIMQVTGDWDAFALANGGAGALAARVLGRVLWDHVADSATQSYLNAAFFHVRRSGEPVTLSYRCDGPIVSARYRMVILPDQAGQLVVNHHAMEQPSAPPVAAPPLGPVNQVRQCSQCLGVLIDGGWHDVRHVMPSRRGLEVETAVCPACRQMALAALGRAQGQVAAQAAH